MKYEPKIYMRLGAMLGSIWGVIVMIVAVCKQRTMIGAVLLAICLILGIIVGSYLEKKHEKK